MKYILYSLLAFGFFSCEKEEPITVTNKTKTLETETIDMGGSSYTKQVFYSLPEAKEISSNLKADWDLAVSTVGKQLFLNSANFASLAKTNKYNFSEVTSTSGLAFSYDDPKGDENNTAAGDWKNTLENDTSVVYVIEKEGLYKKIRLVWKDGTVSILQQDLNGANARQTTLSFDSKYAFTYYSFTAGELDIAPETTHWDLLFTQYTTIFEDVENMPYLVSGVLINKEKVAVAKLSEGDIAFTSITLENAQTLTYSNDLDVIGYNWKTVSSDYSTYTVDMTKLYIIKRGNTYYKLRFIDFYNDKGQKGYPVFEFQQL